MNAPFNVAGPGMCAILLILGLLNGSQPATAAEGWGEIAALVDSETVAVARIELGAISVQQIAQSLLGVPAGSDEPATDVNEIEERVDQFRRHLVESGVQRLWLTLSLAEISQGPAILLPSDNPEATAELFRGLPPRGRDALGRDLQIRVVDDVVVIAPPAIFERLAARPAASRPEVAQVLESVDEFPIAVAVVPTEDMHRVMREMLPDLPPEWGSVSGSALAGALGRLALGLDLSSPTGALVRLEGNTEDDAAAALPAVRKIVDQLGLPISSDDIRREGVVISYRMDDAAVRAVAQTLAGPLRRSRANARRMQSWNHLRQLGLAMHNYHDAHKQFPPSGTAGDGAAAGLSWRVHLLPFLEQEVLYKQFKLDEPWDSEHNRQLIDQMPEVYRSPLAMELPPGKTLYQLPRMEGSIYGVADEEEPPRFRDVTDGLSNTVLLFESNPAAAVTWTQPADLQIDPASIWEHLIAEGREYVSMLRGDGSVHALSTDTAPETVRAIITRAGGERVAAL